MNRYLIRTLLVLIFCCSSEVFSEWKTYTTSNSDLRNNVIKDIFIDSNGSKWFATDGDGVSVLDINGSWTHYHSGNSIMADEVYDIEIATDSALWFGTKDGAFRYDGVTWSSYTTSNSSLPGDVVENIAISTSNLIWFATDTSGLASYDVANNTWTLYTPTLNTDSKLGSLLLKDVSIDNNGVVWIGTNDKGLSSFDGTAWARYTRESTGSKLPSDFIWVVESDRHSNTLIGTKGLGLVKLSADQNTWTTYNVDNSNLPDDTVQAITIDNDNSYWIGTLGGVTRFNGSSWTTYNTENSPLPSNFINSIAIDNTKREIWFATKEGIAVLIEQEVIPETGRVKIQGGARGYVNPGLGEAALIHYKATEPGLITFSIYTLQGKLVWKTSIDSPAASGSVTWDCTNESDEQISSGVYILHTRGPGLDRADKIAVIR